MNIKNLLKGEITQVDLLNYYNASIIYEELPESVLGLVFNYDGVFFILIREELSVHLKKETILHELVHIELNQLEQYDKDLFATHIQDYEDEADDYIKKIINEIREA